MFSAALTLFLVGFSSLCLSQSEDDRQAINNFVEAILEEYGVVGLNLAVVGNAEPYMVEGYGIMNLETEEEVDQDTLFYLGSTTKAFTAALVTQILAEHHTFTLDTPVKEILEDEFYLSEIFRERNVNSRDLLAHRVGIPTGDFFIATFLESEDRNDLISRTRFFEATEPLRSQVLYNNLMYTIAARVAEKLTGLTWEDAIRQYYFQPLQMEGATFLHEATEEELEKLAMSYMPDEEAGGELREVPLETFEGYSQLAPAAGIIVSSNDIMQWLLFQTNHGRGPSGEQVMNQTDFEDTHKAALTDGTINLNYVKPRVPVTYVEQGYSLGWYVGYYRGHRMVAHAGGVPGYYSRATVLPDLGVGVFTSCNSLDWGGMFRIHLYVIDTVLGHEPWINVTSAMGHVHQLNSPDDLLPDHIFFGLKGDSHNILKTNGMSDKSREELEKYEGVYGNFGFGNITVFYDDELEILRAEYGKVGDLHLTADPIRPHVFRAKFQDPFWHMFEISLRFEEEESGEIERVSIPIFLPTDPPLFIRDLKGADAPAPTEDHCQETI